MAFENLSPVVPIHLSPSHFPNFHRHISYQASVIRNTYRAFIHLRNVFSSFPEIVLAHWKHGKPYFVEETIKSAHRQFVCFPKATGQGPEG